MLAFLTPKPTPERAAAILRRVFGSLPASFSFRLWDGQEVRLSMEEDVVYTLAGCRLLDGRQTAFHLIAGAS